MHILHITTLFLRLLNYFHVSVGVHLKFVLTLPSTPANMAHELLVLLFKKVGEEI